jgi:hypothetical protein
VKFLRYREARGDYAKVVHTLNRIPTRTGNSRARDHAESVRSQCPNTKQIKAALDTRRRNPNLILEATVTRLCVNEAVCEALFASRLQPSDALTAEEVADAIGSTVRRLGPAGCASHMAQEFGDHPEAASHRMHWVRQLTGDLSGCLYFPTAAPPETATSGPDLLPVREAA